jgi:hypothetical protein
MTQAKRRLLPLAAAFLAAGAIAPASAGTASFLVVHGIPGRDVAAGLDPLLPVDVLVNGQICLLKNLTFGQIAGPYDVPSGTYSVAVSLANPISPCSNSAVISASVTLTDGEYGAVVAQLSSKGTPTAGVYPIDVSPVAAGMQRFVIAHAADAPAVVARAVSLGKDPEKASAAIKPGAEAETAVPERNEFAATISAPGATFGPYKVGGGDQAVFFLVAVGNATSGSVTVLSKVIPSVF